MRSSFILALAITIAGSVTYWYQSTAAICPAPLEYRIGSIDSSFAITSEEAQEQIAAAAAVWENQFNRELFVYNEEAAFTIEFVFDERQAIANSEESLREELDETRDRNEEVLATVGSLQTQYQSLSQSYKTQTTAYEQRLSNYNARVNSFNDKGGAPATAFAELEDERVALEQEGNRLAKVMGELNTLVDKINALSERGNELVDTYNQEVNQYNTTFGFPREFTQGDYQKGTIHIYKFSNDNELITVLTHELGHALGFDHVEGTSSVMYYLLEDTNRYPVLSQEDIAGYLSVCGEYESWEQTTRRTIREVLTII